jgi:hypothetical protein
MPLQVKDTCRFSRVRTSCDVDTTTLTQDPATGYYSLILSKE